MNRRTTILTAFYLVVCGPLVFDSYAKSATCKRHTVLLLTSPRMGELKNISNLMDSNLLQAPCLKIVGIHHEAEWTDYERSYLFLKQEKPAWLELRRLDCKLSASEVFATNDCSRVFTDLLAESDAVVFTGGPDIPPSLYGEETHLTTVVLDPPRHYFEISFLAHLLRGDPKTKTAPLLNSRPDYLVLGLCLGLQTLNVAMGGTLIQDIPSQVYGIKTLEEYAKLEPGKAHRSASAQIHPASDVGWAVMHPVRFVGKDPLSKQMASKKPVSVLSLHHQAASKIGESLSLMAISQDGKVVEGLTHTRFKSVLAVQFHPEKRTLFDRNMVYRKTPGADTDNYIAQHVARDKRISEFLRIFWRHISKLLQRSTKTRHPHKHKPHQVQVNP